MLTASQTADYFLTLVDEEAGDSLSNLKLQKLIYYAQGFHLALVDSPLFDETIEAWEHGPVVPNLYHTYKQFGSGPIPRPSNGIDVEMYPAETRELLDEIFQVYGQYSAWKLRNFTHSEPPWLDAYKNPVSHEISRDALKRYFQTRVHG
jgi:uncharacterized phage-associated protein